MRRSWKPWFAKMVESKSRPGPLGYYLGEPVYDWQRWREVLWAERERCTNAG
jgi:hypothetical protein